MNSQAPKMWSSAVTLLAFVVLTTDVTGQSAFAKQPKFRDPSKDLLTTPKPAPPSAPAEPELQPRLEMKKVCDHEFIWNDDDSGAATDGAFWRPEVPSGFFSIGDYGQENYDPISGCVTVVREDPKTANTSRPLLIPPASMEEIWLDKGTEGINNGGFWQPEPPSADFVCLGSIVNEGYFEPNRRHDYRCVHRCLVEQIPTRTEGPLWSDKDMDNESDTGVVVTRLHNTNSFRAFDTRDWPLREKVFDLKLNGQCSK